MTTEIEQPSTKSAPLIRPAVAMQRQRVPESSMKLSTTLILLCIIAATLLFSVRYEQLFLKELLSMGFILCYVFAMQLNEERARRALNDYFKSQNHN